MAKSVNLLDDPRKTGGLRGGHQIGQISPLLEKCISSCLWWQLHRVPRQSILRSGLGEQLERNPFRLHRSGLRHEGVEHEADPIPDSAGFGSLAEERLELGEGALDWVEVGP